MLAAESEGWNKDGGETNLLPKIIEKNKQTDGWIAAKIS